MLHFRRLETHRVFLPGAHGPIPFLAICQYADRLQLSEILHDFFVTVIEDVDGTLRQNEADKLEAEQRKNSAGNPPAEG